MRNPISTAFFFFNCKSAFLITTGLVCFLLILRYVIILHNDQRNLTAFVFAIFFFLLKTCDQPPPSKVCRLAWKWPTNWPLCVRQQEFNVCISDCKLAWPSLIGELLHFLVFCNRFVFVRKCVCGNKGKKKKKPPMSMRFPRNASNLHSLSSIIVTGVMFFPFGQASPFFTHSSSGSLQGFNGRRLRAVNKTGKQSCPRGR